MDIESLSPLQREIVKVLEQFGGKARFSEAIIAKKIRENTGIEGKKNAGICLSDIEKAVLFFEENNSAFYSMILNSANDILIEKASESRPLSDEARSRRIRSEKSRVIFTNGDLQQKKKAKKGSKSRTKFFEDE